jgi:hypothetical protein
VNETENRLRDLLEAAVGEPPHRVTAETVRQRVIRRRMREALGVAAIVVLVAGVAVAAAVRMPGTGHASGPISGAGAPRYYVQQSYQAAKQPPGVVRATATGAVTDTIHCPWPNATIAPEGITAAGQQAFFMVCERITKEGKQDAITGSRIYRFQLTGSGGISGYSLVPGGVLGHHRAEGITATLDGSKLAVTVGQAILDARQAVPAEVYVINTHTGARAIWRGGTNVFSVASLTFTDNGNALEFIGLKKCALARGGTACKQLRTIGPATAGGQLDSSHVLLPLSALATHRGDYVNQVLINPRGATLAATIVHSGCCPGSDSVSVIKYSTATGRELRVLYHMRTGNGFFYRFFSADPASRYLILNAGPTSGTVNGWIDHGRLIRLTPANGSNILYETW